MSKNIPKGYKHTEVGIRNILINNNQSDLREEHEKEKQKNFAYQNGESERKS